MKKDDTMKYARGGMTSLDYLMEIQRLENELKKYDWVSVKDRLPNEDEAVMVYNAKLDSMYVDCPLYLGEPKLHFDAGVTHWMPLPQPPTNKNENI